MRPVAFAVIGVLAGLTGAEAAKFHPPVVDLGVRHTLACYVEVNRELYVGTPVPPQVPRGTVVQFTTVRDSDGSAYASRFTVQAPLPVHVFAPISYLPAMFKPGATCSAYWESPPVMKMN